MSNIDTPTVATPVAGQLLVSLARTPVERRLVEDYLDDLRLAASAAGDLGDEVPLPRVIALPETTAELAAFSRLMEDNLEMRPVAVLWRPAERDGRRRAAFTEIARGINPYRPTERQQRIIVRADPDRATVVTADPATVAQLRERWAEIGHDEGGLEFARYVVRRARLAIERAESAVLGPTYKSPRLVKDEILASNRFRRGLEALEHSIGRHKVSLDEAETMLGELATGWSRLIADLIPEMGRRTFEKGFDPRIDLVPEELTRLRATVAKLPVIFLWSHRSNMDNPVLTISLHDEGLPMPHTFAGINMAFGPIGLIYRRAGVVFIRRNIGDNPVYKYVLKEYVGYLVERRFNLSWSIEGTRSRTGKMLPPKLGLLAYAAEAYLEGRTDDIALQPVSISFDQLHEIEEYADYASGAAKQPEGYRWVVNYIREQGTRFFGRAYVRFPEAVSMREFLGPPNGEVARDEGLRKLALQKMAFEVASRINKATPVTPTALVTSVLLGSRGLGLTAPQTHAALQAALDHLDKMSVPLADSVAGLRTLSGVRDALDALTSGGPVTVIRQGREPVWLIEPENQLAASFYRNSIIHVFLNAAICEIAALAAARTAERDLRATASPLVEEVAGSVDPVVEEVVESVDPVVEEVAKRPSRNQESREADSAEGAGVSRRPWGASSTSEGGDSAEGAGVSRRPWGASSTSEGGDSAEGAGVSRRPWGASSTSEGGDSAEGAGVSRRPRGASSTSEGGDSAEGAGVSRRPWGASSTSEGGDSAEGAGVSRRPWGASSTSGVAVEEFWQTAYRLRDLLKFEFYFSDKAEFRRGLEAEMLRLGDDWESLLGRGTDALEDRLVKRLPLTASFTVRPFLESYAIVADVLAEASSVPTRKAAIEAALGLGEQYVAQQRIHSREAVSALVFGTALDLFASYGLLAESPDRQARTADVHRELLGLLRLIHQVDRLGERAFADGRQLATHVPDQRRDEWVGVSEEEVAGSREEEACNG